MGVVPIVWNNVDLRDLRPPIDPSLVLDDIARLGFDGCQHGLGFPEDSSLRPELDRRGIRLAEVYAAIPCGSEGPHPGALDQVSKRLEILERGGGDMLVIALDIHPARSSYAARSEDPSCPVLSNAGWHALADLITTVATKVADQGRRVSFHPHVGTHIEGSREVARLVDLLQTTSVGLCLDVGHWLLGGGDPVAAVRDFGDLISHIHLKDVDPEVRRRLAEGQLSGFEEAVRHRVFTELGSGSLDVLGVLASLADIGYQGWMMIEQDTSWLTPSESAAVGLHTVRFAIKALEQ